MRGLFYEVMPYQEGETSGYDQIISKGSYHLKSHASSINLERDWK